MASDNGLVIDDVTSDLVQILDVVDELEQNEGAASYDRVYETTSGELSLHLLSYIRFLEGASLLRYDRISDEIEVTDQGDEIRVAPDQIREQAQEAFSDRLSDEVSTVDQPGGGDDSLPEMDTREDYADVFGEAVDGLDEAIDDDPPVSDEGVESDAGGVSFGGIKSQPPVDGAGGQQAAEHDEASAFDDGETRRVASPPEESPNLVPSEETSMNGQTQLPASDDEEAISDRHGATTSKAYERIEEIGSGGIGTVFRGRQVRLDREVAIKEIREIFNVFAGVQRDDIVDRFQSIVETQASLLHPNIVQLIDIDTTAEYPFSVMQYAPNGDLRRLIDHGERPPLKVSLKYFLQMLHAINTAHDQGVVHGSLKPENVVLDQAGNALLTDFGISKIVERDGGRGNQVYVGVGSVAYMSPEQFQDPNLATVQSDIYSLGIIFYEMLTGKVPGRRSPMPSSFYPDIPRALDDIFDRMSMDREDDRYDSIDEIILDLHRAEAVLDLLDKRSGVLFLRDPMTHGEFGFGGEVDLELEAGGDVTGQPVVDEAGDVDEDESSDSTADSGPEAADDDGEGDVDESPADAEGQDDGEKADSDSPQAPSDDDGADDEADDEAGDDTDGDVLNKLDKYGEMFDE